MKKWVEDICYALCHQTTKNVTDVYIDYTEEYHSNKVIGACALGELLLQKPVCGVNMHNFTSKSGMIRISLLENYKVPKHIVEDVFVLINGLNLHGYTKKQISKKVKEKYE